MYIKRHLEEQVELLSKSFPVVMICGQRQAGKSTLLYNIKSNRNYVTFDDADVRNLAINDPKSFFKEYKYPIIIDEFQRVPEILFEIKRIVDKLSLEGKNNSGLFWLSGSENFLMMKNITDSLAGRVGILQISTLSNREINECKPNVFDPSIQKIKQMCLSAKPMDENQLFERIFKGGMPEYIVQNKDRRTFFSNYINTYLDRDVHGLEQIGKLNEFHQLMTQLAMRVSNELNYADLSRIIGVSCPTIKQWCEVLERCGIIYILRPYYNKVNDRLIKTPKIYFLDSGLAAFLAGWNSAEAIHNSPMAGAYFENYVVSEILKSFKNGNTSQTLYYYRDRDQRELDLIYEDGDKIYPIEIKKNKKPTIGKKTFKVLDKYKKDKQPGLIICMSGELKQYNDSTWFVPAWAI